MEEEIDYEKYLNVEWKVASIGDYVLLAKCGIWEYTHVTKNNNIGCSGLDSMTHYLEKVRVIPKHNIDKLKTINYFKEGDFVSGTYRNKIVKGYVTDVHWNKIETPIWIKDSIDGYNKPIERNGVEKCEPLFSFLEWLRKIKHNYLYQING